MQNRWLQNSQQPPLICTMLMSVGQQYYTTENNKPDLSFAQIIMSNTVIIITREKNKTLHPRKVPLYLALNMLL